MRTRPAVRGLLDAALTAYRDTPEAAAALHEQRRRLEEPLRVALAGAVKAGKSTLLNAFVGERLAPTDAGECTLVVTWYRHGVTPAVSLERKDGGSRPLPVRRIGGELRLDLGGAPPEDVARLVVDWPSAALAQTTLIDTPGLGSLTVSASARTESFIGGPAGEADGGPGADALVFLTRQMQPEDLAFLSAFQAASGLGGSPATTLVVLSRADEVAAGRLDALLVAEEVARRTAEDPAVRALSAAVVPVAGLIGLGGRTLRHRDFVALRGLAAAPDADLERMLLTADRFCRPEAPVPVAAELRASLIERLGLFGIRLAIALIRTGTQDAATLADELVRRSGLGELQRLLGVRFTQRGDVLKEAAAMRTVERQLRAYPIPAARPLWTELERIRLASPALVELDLLARLRGADSPLPAERRPEAERLLGADGTAAAERLGLPAGAPAAEVRSAALAAAGTWRDLAEDPLSTRPGVRACELVVRACEAILADLDGAGSAAG